MPDPRVLSPSSSRGGIEQCLAKDPGETHWSQPRTRRSIVLCKGNTRPGKTGSLPVTVNPFFAKLRPCVTHTWTLRHNTLLVLPLTGVPGVSARRPLVTPRPLHGFGSVPGPTSHSWGVCSVCGRGTPSTDLSRYRSVSSSGRKHSSDIGS